MVIGELKTKLNSEDIVERLKAVMGWKLISRIKCKTTDSIKLACIGNNWRGKCIFIIKIRGNTIVDNLSGCLGILKKEDWISIAGENSLLFQEYNDSIEYGQFVKINEGILLKYCLFDSQSSISESNDQNINSWIDIASIVDEDNDISVNDEIGELVIFSDELQ